MIACANVANLLLARASSRRKEDFGARRVGRRSWRIATTVMDESVSCRSCGTLGVLVAWWGTKGARRFESAGR